LGTRGALKNENKLSIYKSIVEFPEVMQFILYVVSRCTLNTYVDLGHKSCTVNSTSRYVASHGESLLARHEDVEEHLHQTLQTGETHGTAAGDAKTGS
jgi:hypothetical protein